MRSLPILFLMLLASLATHTEARAQASFTWSTGMFGECSVACGGGSQTRTVECLDSNDVVVADSFCDPGSRPVDSQSCNTQACTYDWVTGAYGTCSAACGGGTQTRSVVCDDGFGNVVADSFCDPGSRPVDAQSCNTQACSYDWVTGAYGTCSAACGGGTQTRPVVCDDGFGNVVADSFCDPGSRPVDTQSCNTQACTYDWVTGAYGTCSAACGGGTQTRSVVCEDELGNVASDALCDPELRPVDSQACNTQACICEAGDLIDLGGCTPCSPGSFTDQGDQTSCTLCPADTFAAAPGSTECAACPAGTFSSPGAEACEESLAVPVGSPFGWILLMVACVVAGALLLAAGREGHA